MKTLITFALGTWFGFFVCAILSINKDNEYERQKEYEEQQMLSDHSHE